MSGPCTTTKEFPPLELQLEKSLPKATKTQRSTNKWNYKKILYWLGPHWTKGKVWFKERQELGEGGREMVDRLFYFKIKMIGFRAFYLWLKMYSSSKENLVGLA